jgi:hypothetical protein
MNLRYIEGVKWDQIEITKGNYKDLELQYEV